MVVLHSKFNRFYSAGHFPGGFNSWQHPALSASIYPLQEAPYQEGAQLTGHTPLQAFPPAGLKPQQGAQA